MNLYVYWILTIVLTIIVTVFVGHCAICVRFALFLRLCFGIIVYGAQSLVSGLQQIHVKNYFRSFHLASVILISNRLGFFLDSRFWCIGIPTIGVL